MAQQIVDARLNVALSNVLQAMSASAIMPLMVLDGIATSDMHDVEVDSGLTLVDGDLFECAGNAYWTYEAGNPSLGDERYASIKGRIVDGEPIVEIIAVSVH